MECWWKRPKVQCFSTKSKAYKTKGIKFKSSGMFLGTTEIDECYVGGSDSNKPQIRNSPLKKLLLLAW